LHNNYYRSLLWLILFLQNSTERDIKNSLFADQKQRQTESTKAISQHINSDLNLVLANLKILGNYGHVQNGNISNINVRNLMQEIYAQINPIADRLYNESKWDYNSREGAIR
jgi:hypothetical protein